MGIRLRSGRTFDRNDRRGSAPVAIVSERAARLLGVENGAVGQRIRLAGSPRDWRTIVGVAAETRYRAFRDVAPTVYLPLEQFSEVMTLITTVVVRTDGPPAAVVPSIRDAVMQTDTDVAVLHAAALSDLVGGQLDRAATQRPSTLDVWCRSRAAGCRWPLFGARGGSQGASSRACHPSGDWSHACSPSAFGHRARGLALWGGACVRAGGRTGLRSPARYGTVRRRPERLLHGARSRLPPADHLGGGQLCAGATGHSTRCHCAAAGCVSRRAALEP